MEFGPRLGKEQAFGLNRINCPYFVSSITKPAQGSKDVGGSIILSTRHLGIVSLNILMNDTCAKRMNHG
ncbi:Isopentenyl-diphosphate delta-isomerase [Gossypium arboreum]|uniref:Isopentenyl-diphosphate delta-isomerase n=1 Tax=Gossypium arboreum TaxID=29729 RepID=A0A0B0N9M6_GOSAR|nr:Isopentenyl-diphosphate delta-isomerase [Gossypium arboreum]